jgi:hypothetical protein
LEGTFRLMPTDAQLDAGENVLLEQLGSTRLSSLFAPREAVAQIYNEMRQLEPIVDTPQSFHLKLDVGDLQEALKAFHDDVNRLCGAMTAAIEAAPEDHGR